MVYGGAMRCMWAPEQNLAKLDGKRAVDGSDAARGRMSGLDGWMSGVAGCPVSGSLDELRMEGGKSGQNSEEFVDGNWGKVDGKLDLPATHEIRGSNPTKLHHTNKSQKKLGLFLSGNFRDEKQQNQARKRGVGAPKT